MKFLLLFVNILVVSNWICPVISKDALYEPVSKHGQLSVDGVNLIDEHGERVQLKGMGLFWSVWMPYFYNQTTVDGIKNYCHSNIVRPMLAIDTKDGGYLTDPEGETALIDAVIDAAIEDDIYVLVDWQDFEAENHLEQSLKYFDRLSKKYGSYPNIIYEPYNEPISLEWSTVVKPYHEAVIKTIRANDPDNLIVVGTPNYSQRLDLAAADPINGTNIMYSLHFYAASHRQEERDITKNAIEAGLPVFVSEYGTVNYDASGPVDVTESLLWYDLMEEYGLSYVNYAISDKDEGTSALIPGTTPDKVCREEYLSESGRLVVEHNKA
uniref:Cellulase 5 n=1 Tax=Mesosa myops TaxID=993118 RepID=A0A0X8D9B0_9CUCU|nr:cellulase 5 [Mesosa myops]